MATNTGMLRSTRDRSDSGVREGDLRNNRRDNLTQFYEDLGFSATTDDHTAYVEDEERYQNLMAEQQATVDSATKKYNTYKTSYDKDVKSLAEAQANLPSLEEGVDKSWKEYQKTLVPVNVLGGWVKGGTRAIEKTYYLPEESIQNLSQGIGFHKEWGDDGSLNVWKNSHKTNTHDGGSTFYNKPLHEALSEGAASLEEQFKQAASSQLAKELSSTNAEYLAAANALSESAGVLNGYKSDLTAAQSKIDTSQADREAQWQALRDKYANRAETMKSIFGDLNIEAA